MGAGGKRASEMYWVVTKGLVYVSLESQKERKRDQERKILEEIMVKNFPNLVTDI